MGSSGKKDGRPLFKNSCVQFGRKEGWRKEEGRIKRGKRGKIIKAVPRKRASVALALWFVCFFVFLCCEV